MSEHDSIASDLPDGIKLMLSGRAPFSGQILQSMKRVICSSF